MPSTESNIKFENYDEIRLPDNSKIIVCTIPLEHGIKRTMILAESIKTGFSTVTTDPNEAYNDFLALGKIIRHAISVVSEADIRKPILRIFQEKILNFFGGELKK